VFGGVKGLALGGATLENLDTHAARSQKT